jgi:hypothetical protein
MNKDAVIDSTGLYRYSLWREWDANTPRIAFIMLNPSRADAAIDDPTIRRCIGFAKDWGYGSLEVVNLFAYRAQHPKILQQIPDPIGPENDRYLQEAVERCDRGSDLAKPARVIVAWGNWGRLKGRNEEVLRAMRSRTIYCLGITSKGQPRHPLYVRSNTNPVYYDSETYPRPTQKSGFLNDEILSFREASEIERSRHEVYDRHSKYINDLND